MPTDLPRTEYGDGEGPAVYQTEPSIRELRRQKRKLLTVRFFYGEAGFSISILIFFFESGQSYDRALIGSTMVCCWI